ncbi:MAG: 3-oxoacyl-ACP synthase [Chloroflexi bacterium]|nr:MAG: 3-oxoacyl-ACP synthase [Chloroflexota bacterium]HDN79157.1 ketoacyl-ACP synthase III [Chloroflexota bacterium]
MGNFKYARITGWGMYAPKRVLTNFDLEKMVDTSNEWILERTGIKERHIASPEETVSTMSVEASKEALERAGLSPQELELIIIATSSPDYHLPAAANLVQDMLGAPYAAAFDLRAGCTGFIYALAVASQFIVAGTYRNALVVGAEIITKFIDWEDRSTCVLFGDGAGAVVLQASDFPTGPMSFVLGSDGSQAEALIVYGGGSKYPFSQEVLDKKLHYLRMNGRQVFKFATRAMAQAIREVVASSGLLLDEIDLIIPHQANVRIIQVAAKELGIPMEKFYINLERYGNTSAASVPIALCEALERGLIKDGDNIVLVGFGAGLTWGATLVRWGVPEAIPFFVVEPAKAFSLVRKAKEAAADVASYLMLPFYTIKDWGRSIKAPWRRK